MYPNNSPYQPQNQPNNPPQPGTYPPQPPVYPPQNQSQPGMSSQSPLPNQGQPQNYSPYQPQYSQPPISNYQSNPYQAQQPAPPNYPPQPTRQPVGVSGGDSTPKPPPRMRRYDKPPLPIRMIDWMKKNWWAPAVGILILVAVSNVIYQIAYPAEALPPGVSIDGIETGRASRSEIIEKLNEEYGKIPVEIYFGSATTAYKISPAKEVGIVVDNSDRMQNASYPLWLRLVPTSIWWAAGMVKVGEPVYKYDKVTLDKYTLKELGADCKIQPKNASLKLEDNQFTVVKFMPGGTCNVTDFAAEVQKTRLDDNGKFVVRSTLKEVDAQISDEKAKELADKLNKILAGDFKIKAGDQTSKVPGNTIKGWLTFKEIIPAEGEKGEPRLKPEVDSGRFDKYLQSTVASRVEKKPGTTTITTKDFTLLSQVNGAPGVVIDLEATTTTVYSILAEQGDTITVTTKEVGPTVQYKRSYSPNETGFRALVEQFAHDNPGQIGLVVQEDSGKKPLISVAANDQMQLPSLGFEGFYLAYAAQAGIEDGSLQPTDKVAGNLSLQDCITEAITEQSKDCIDGMLLKIGNDTVHNRLRAIGLTGTVLSGKTSKTTARDMSLLMQKIMKKELGIKQMGVLENAMRNNKYRDGMIRVAGGNSYSATGGGDSGYLEQILVNDRGRFTLSYISDNKDPKQAQKFFTELNKLRTEKNNLKN